MMGEKFEDMERQALARQDTPPHSIFTLHTPTSSSTSSSSPSPSLSPSHSTTSLLPLISHSHSPPHSPPSPLSPLRRTTTLALVGVMFIAALAALLCSQALLQENGRDREEAAVLSAPAAGKRSKEEYASALRMCLSFLEAQRSGKLKG